MGEQKGSGAYKRPASGLAGLNCAWHEHVKSLTSSRVLLRLKISDLMITTRSFTSRSNNSCETFCGLQEHARACAEHKLGRSSIDMKRSEYKHESKYSHKAHKLGTKRQRRHRHKASIRQSKHKHKATIQEYLLEGLHSACASALTGAPSLERHQHLAHLLGFVLIIAQCEGGR